MKFKNIEIPIFVFMGFLITAPIGQMVFGYLGGYLTYLFSKTLPFKTQDLSTELMFFFTIISLISYIKSNSQIGLIVSAIFSTLSICNTVLFFSIESKVITEYFYPDRFVIGSILSFITLISISIIRTKKYKLT